MSDKQPSNSEAGGHEKTLPDRLSTNPQSPFHNAELLERGVGVLFNGVDRNNVEEYCVSEGWVRLAVGKTVDRHGNAMTVIAYELLYADSGAEAAPPANGATFLT